MFCSFRHEVDFDWTVPGEMASLSTFVALPFLVGRWRGVGVGVSWVRVIGVVVLLLGFLLLD